jgi:hypothetical protein
LQGDPVTSPNIEFCFLAFYDSHGYGGGILSNLHKRNIKFVYEIYLVSISIILKHHLMVAYLGWNMLSEVL